MQIVEQRGVSDSEDHDGREKQTYRPVGEVRYPALYLILFNNSFHFLEGTTIVLKYFIVITSRARNTNATLFIE
jgi:hypothetical protein